MARKPVLIDIEDGPAPDPSDAPIVPDLDQGTPDNVAAMQRAAQLAARPPSRLARFLWATLAGLIGLWVSVAVWDFTTALIERNATLGYLATGLAFFLLIGCAILVLREAAAFARLSRIDRIQQAATKLQVDPDLEIARGVVAQLDRLYSGRPDLSWALSRLRELGPSQLDAETLMVLAETELMTSLDTAAEREVAAAARQVAAVTALVPLALADVLAALVANLRMIRAVAQIYGGRSGSLGTWRLMRSVMTHLVATGAVAVGDDMLGSIAGGGLLSKLSRRFGEGLVNGALTARVGVAAMEVCRPLPFSSVPRPSVSKLVQKALTGLFSRAERREPS